MKKDICDVLGVYLTYFVIILVRSLIVYLAYIFLLEPGFNLPYIGYWQWFAILLIVNIVFGRVVHHDE